MDIRQIQFGRISPSMNVDEVVNMISSEITSKCQDCEILSTETADTLPEKYMGIFSSKQFDFTYVAVATNNRNTGDIRYIFPDLDPQPGCDDLSDYVNTQKQLFKDIGVVTCVDPADSEARKQALIALDEYGSGLEKESEHDYEGARLHFEQAVALKPEDPVYLDALAKVLYVLADYEGTLLAFEKSTEIYRQKHGDDHPEVAINLTAIGAVLDELGEYAKAIEYHEKALEILISNYGENHELVANALNNLGMSLEKLEVYERARGLIEKALAINKALLGAEHPVVASNYSNLGSISEKMGEYQKAIEYKEHALMLGRKEYGNDHPKIALRLNNVGWTCYLMGDYQKALQCYEEAETIYLKYFTEDHPDIQLLRDNMELVKVKL